MTARAAILAAIRSATADVPGSAAAIAAGDGGDEAPTVPEGLTARAAARIAEYQATVTRVADLAEVGSAVTAALHASGARSVVVPGDLASGHSPDRRVFDVSTDGDPPMGHDQLARTDAVVTGCALCIAETGTIVLDAGAGQGRRVLTLLPDVHVCVVRSEQIVPDVPQAIALLARGDRPVTFISGPSATSDIELERVEGVHGPRTLAVILVDPEPSASDQAAEPAAASS